MLISTSPRGSTGGGAHQHPPGRPLGPAVDRHAARSKSASGTGFARVAPAHRRVLAPPHLPRFARGINSLFRSPDPRRARRGERVRCGGLATRSSLPTFLSPARSAEGELGSSDGRWAGVTRARPTTDRTSCARRACPRPGRAFSRVLSSSLTGSPAPRHCRSGQPQRSAAAAMAREATARRTAFARRRRGRRRSAAGWQPGRRRGRSAPRAGLRRAGARDR